MSNWKKIGISALLVMSVSVLAWFGVRKLADHYIIYLFADPKEFDWSHFGLTDNSHKRQQAAYLFAIFPSLLCPAADHYVHDEANKGELRVVVLFGVPAFTKMGADHKDVLNLLRKWLKDDSTDINAARYLSDFGMDAEPALVDAWQGPGSLGLKMEVAHSLVRIGDKSCLPELQQSLDKDRSFAPSLSAQDKEASGQAVLAAIALYKLTHEEKYKDYIERLLKKGARSSKMLAFMFMGTGISSHGVYADAEMVPFLKEGLKDKDPKTQEFAQRSLAEVYKILKKEPGKGSVEKSR